MTTSTPDAATRPAATAQTNLSYLIPICFVATLGGLLFGYYTGVISGPIEPLTARFGLGDVMKGWTSGCVLIGCAAGVLLVGPLSDRFGRKFVIWFSIRAALRLIATFRIVHRCRINGICDFKREGDRGR